MTCINCGSVPIRARGLCSRCYWADYYQRRKRNEVRTATVVERSYPRVVITTTTLVLCMEAAADLGITLNQFINDSLEMAAKEDQ